MSRLRSILWWLGVPVVVGLFAWGPYAAMNAVHHVSWPFWRVPFVPIVLFDTSAYLEWMGAALSGIAFGDHIRTFAWIIPVFGKVLPTSLSVAEVWLVTCWVSVAASVWLMAKAIAAWSGLSTPSSRWFAVLATTSLILPFMPRPGVYTWYAPLYVLGLICAFKVQQSLETSRILHAVAWSIVALAATWTYPYFLVHLFIWLVVLWLVYLHGRYRKIIRILGAAGIVIIIPFVILVTPWLMQPKFRLALELQQRVGLAFSRLPVISNSLILVFAWLGFCFLVARIGANQESSQRRLYGITIGWITLLLGWLSNVFTGVYIHSDHFRAPAVILSWISLAVVWGVASDMRVSEQKRSRLSAYALWGFIGVSALMLLNYLFNKQYVFHGDFLNVIHASHWLTLLIASVVIWSAIGKRSLSSKAILAICSVIAIALGLSARGFLFAEEMKKFPTSIPYISTIEWIRAHIPAMDGLCTDPESAEILGSFTARLAYPTFASIALPKPDAEVMNDLRVELSRYDVTAAKTEAVYVDTFSSMRGTTCAQYASLATYLKRFGYSPEEVNRIAGCPMDQIRAEQEQIRGYLLSAYRPDDASFRGVCPSVIVRKDQRSYWTLPSDYRETVIDKGFSAWQSGSEK
jgi:hypothetical protein